ncbi:hypothetical protein PFICI_09436 [Pestalotiopsis fici W106-1]|uniref:3'-5' exonuclease domain-containing protein n=1 Tax=Pestalotiopsis fici (strain W106-1 / CGMCC3.15140) TaxID=1229662 RepID=W3X0B8_PESFW|nr:uncharacterized protein PFICI_09436 [Pestalotiopsis fici W106-1]ETS79583.1 hypothetical protein PFICI_09436 [Pestalotiopsis fici W106-1]
MTTSPPNFQVWHPSRGISFSPGPSRSPTPVRQSRPVSYSAPMLADSNNALLSTLDTEAQAQVSEQDVVQLGIPMELEDTSALYPELPKIPIAQGTDAKADDAPANTPVDPDVAKKAKDETETETVIKKPLDLPFPALDFKMSEDLFRAAQKSAPGSPGSFWGYSLYRGPDATGNIRKPTVHYCRSKHTAERVCQQYFKDEKVLGFDLEWVAEASKSSGPRRNVSLIQVASPSRIALFHVALFSKIDDLVPPTFKKIMEDPEITKVGVWIKGDATRLRTHLGIDSKGLMELSHLYRLVTYSRTGEFRNINKRLIPLATQVEQYLHLPMFKGQDVRSSDWAKQLSMEQVIYSASDAYAGVHLYATLEHHRKQLVPCPPTPHHAELNLPIRLSDGLDLETDTEEENSETPPDETAEISTVLSPAARKRALKAHLRSCRAAVDQVAKALRETEKLLDAVIARDVRVEAAETWATAFITENYASDPAEPDSTNKARAEGHAKFIELRAYHLWHTNKDLSTGDVAALLRSPPLKTTTVADYIFNAVKLENLPVNDSRYSKEVIETKPGRWQKYRRSLA